MSKFLTTKEFIKKAKLVHDNKYDYQFASYDYARSKIRILCKQHGIFEQLAYKHLDKHGCPKCGRLSSSKALATGKEFFVRKAKNIHDDKYDYSKVEYKNTHTKVCIICPVHGEFWQRPHDHLIKQGCKKCGILLKADNTETFIKKAKEAQKSIYDYSKIDYKNSKTKVIIGCLEHGDFLQRPTTHLAGFGCAKCSESRGEKEIRCILEWTETPFRSQYRIAGCKNKNTLPFDFAIMHKSNL